MGDDDNGHGWTGFWTGLVIAIVVTSIIWGIGKGGRYEGQTAEEWFFF